MLVECRSDSVYAERPLAFTWHGQRLAVQMVLQSWRTPSAKCFLVRAADQQIYELAYDKTANEWHIHPI